MHRLFAIDYLVHEICSHVQRSELPILARISSTWFRCAVSCLYKDVEINQALAPLGKTTCQYGMLQFLDSPSDENFERLRKYTPCVRYLDMDLRAKSIALNAIRKSVSKGIPYLFPNIKSIKWYFGAPDHSPECIEILIGLISPNIAHFSLNVEDGRVLDYICPLMTTRLSTLSSVHIRDEVVTTNSENLPVAKPAQELFTTFTDTLTLVHISLSLNTSPIIECLSKMPNLVNLVIGEYSIEELKGSEIFKKNRGNFPSLRSFSFDGLPQSFCAKFLSPYGLASLTLLSLNAEFTPVDVSMIISFIVVSCPHIQEMDIGLAEDRPLTYVWSVVPWNFIQPISRCKKLSALSLHRMYVSVSLEDLKEFLKSRTTWTTLRILTSNPLRLQDIPLYAKHCPNLQHLAVHIDDRVGFSIEDLPSDIPTFSTLISIDFAHCSHITKSSVRLLAQFLYRISKTPLCELFGFYDHGDFTQDILTNLVGFYIDEEFKTGKPMTSAVREFVRMMATRSFAW